MSSPLLRLTAVLLFGFLSVAPAANANLTDKCAQLLIQAKATGELKVQILTIEMGGKLKVAVIMGERHWGNAHETSRIAREVAAQFQHIAVEGAHVSNLWGGIFIKKILEYGHRESEEAGFAGSAIRHLAGTAMRENVLQQVAQILIEEKISIEQVLEVGTVNVEEAKMTFTAAETVEEMRRLGAPENQDRPTYFGLEDGHRWTVGQQFASLIMPVAKDLVFDYVLMEGRERTMAANIDKIFKTRVDVQTLLIVVGQAHIPGLTQKLKAKGYRVPRTK